MRIRRLIIIGAIIALLFVGGSICMGKLDFSSARTDTPVNTASAAIMAMEKKEAAKVTQYFTPTPGAAMANRLNILFAKCETIDIANLSVMLVLEEGVAARVQASYDIIWTQGGYVNTQHEARLIKLVKYEKRWWINEAF